jgi:hypothetical protein
MHATSHPALAIAGHSPHLKLRPPPPYTHLTGKMPLDVWLFQVERYLGVLAVDDDRTMIEYTSSLLHEDALAWLQSYARDHPDYTHTMSWEDFTKELRRQFMPLMAEAVARQELMKLVQGAKSIQQYITTFRHISQRIVTMDTVTRKQLFINGLHPSIQWSIQKDDKPENTLEEVMAQATKLDVMRQQFRRQIAGGVGYGRGTFLNRNVPSRGYNNHRPVQYSDFRSSNHPTDSGSTSVPMELGAAFQTSNTEPMAYSPQTEEDEANDQTIFDPSMLPSELDDDIDEDMEYSIVAAAFQNQRNRMGGNQRSNNEQREYKPKWYKIIPNLTATEETRLFKERRCYICRGSGHRLFRCPKILEGSFVKRDRINNIQVGVTVDGEEEKDQVTFSEFMSKNGFGQ